ncbi:MAG: glycerophosphodiester phosphodiesterase family protein [Chitinophagales bacterium]
MSAEEPPAKLRTLKIAHRGGRSDSVRENTLNGFKEALRNADGVEVDVQISGDKTIWLSHSSRVHAYDGDRKCFAETSDKEIENINTCNGKEGSYTGLEDLFKYMNEHHIRKPVCIDIKETFPCISARSISSQ